MRTWRIEKKANCHMKDNFQGVQHVPSVRMPKWDDQVPQLVFQMTIEIGHGGGLVVSLLAFYSDDLSSNPAANLFLNFCTVL